jgi:hypothetical protein
MAPLAYQVGLSKLGIPGLVLLAVLGALGVYRRKGALNAASARMALLLVALVAGVIALIEGYTLYGGGLVAVVVVLSLYLALRGTLSGDTATTPDRRAGV